MSKDTIDYSALNNTFHKKAFRLADVKDQLETVAFDIVRFKDGDKGAELWQIQSADDGEYIVALYQSDEEKTASSPWGASINKLAGELYVSYKGEPLVKIAASKLGIPADQLNQVPSYLPEKLSGNKKLVLALLNQLPASAKNAVLKKYPELG